MSSAVVTLAGFIGIVTLDSLSKFLSDGGLHETVIALWVCSLPLVTMETYKSTPDFRTINVVHKTGSHNGT